MRFEKTGLAGAYLIALDEIQDDRGFFARAWCRNEAEAHGLNPAVAQCNVSFNRRPGTLRGLHYQAAPHEEAKVVRCTMGSIYDVIVDLRTDSPTFKRWVAFELSAANRRMVYIPEGVAHGFQTLEPDTEVFYQMSSVYVPEAARGVRWDDPAFGIEWPPADRTIAERDRRFPDFEQ